MKEVGGVSPCILSTAGWGKGGAEGPRWRLQVETLPCSGSRVAGKTCSQCMSAGSSLRCWSCCSFSFSSPVEETVLRLVACMWFFVQDEGETLVSHTVLWHLLSPDSSLSGVCACVCVCGWVQVLVCQKKQLVLFLQDVQSQSNSLITVQWKVSPQRRPLEARCSWQLPGATQQGQQ